jgi:hypothetical protein
VRLFILFFGFAQLFSVVTFGQKDNNYKDLLIFYVDGEYEKCIKNAKKYLKDKECATDEFPYLIASATYFAISKDQIFDKKYPNAFEQALEYVGLSFGKSKANSKYSESINSFIDNLIKMSIEDVENSFYARDSTNFKEGVHRLNQLIKFNPLEPGFLLLKSAHQNFLKDTLAANESYEAGIKLMNTIGSLEAMSKNGKRALMLGLFFCSDYCISEGQEDKALIILNQGGVLFSEDQVYQDYLELYR